MADEENTNDPAPQDNKLSVSISALCNAQRRRLMSMENDLLIAEQEILDRNDVIEKQKMQIDAQTQLIEALKKAVPASVVDLGQAAESNSAVN